MIFGGGPEGIRTLDLSDANRTLSQLSYKPGYERLSRAAHILYLFWRKMQAFYSMTGNFATTAAQRGHRSGYRSSAPTSG